MEYSNEYEQIITNIYEFMKRNNISYEKRNMDIMQIIDELNRNEIIIIDGINKNPRGNRKKVIFIIMKPESITYSWRSFKAFETLIAPIKKDDELDRLIILIKNEIGSSLHKVIHKLQLTENIINPDDISGLRPFFNIYHFSIFITIIPDHVLVPKHEIIEHKEYDDLAKHEYVNMLNMPLIFDNDPAIVWISGRPNQIVAITRLSETVGYTLFYRRIVRGTLLK